MFPLDENSQSKSISPRARTFGDPFTFSCSNYQEIHTRSQHPNLKILNNTLQGFHIGKEYRKKDQTRLTYNCAHLRSTKESLTIEYLRRKLYWIFWETFLG